MFSFRSSNLKLHPVPTMFSKKYTSFCDGDVKGEQQKELDQVDTHGGILRFMGYFRAAGVLVSKGVRYMAYTSDVGEAFRPILPSRAVTLAYGLSWSYVLGDVAYHGYEEYNHGSDSKKIGVVVFHSAVFQSIASMAIPTLLIHTVVHQSHHLLAKAQSLPPAVRMYGPSALGLSCIPLLPMVDEPVELLIDNIFHRIFPEEMKKTHKPHHE